MRVRAWIRKRHSSLLSRWGRRAGEELFELDCDGSWRDLLQLIVNL